MSDILPKRRNISGTTNRINSNRLQDLSKQGRVISGRSISKSKRIISNRNELIDTSFGEDAINFDLNKNTILSNFEEWIKLSTDNKITSKNSWQFALIDYFHDLNVIKDGDDINFQRASATLDGCVKIYLSRVESVATETGKLLSGLANKKNDHDDADNDNDNNDHDDDDNELGNDDTRKVRKINRVMESTLVSFNTIKIKKLDQELSIDPLFKKALAEFDEGGAKSLLLNTLNIDKTGRVVFDATTTGKQIDTTEFNLNSQDSPNAHSINLSNVKNLLFKDDGIDNLTICPSIEQLKSVINDIGSAKAILSDVNNKYMNDDPHDEIPEVEINNNDFDFGNYDDNDFNDVQGDDGNDELPDDIPGDINEMDDIEGNDNNNDLQGNHEVEYELGPGNQILDQDLMAYFDETMKSNWRGPEHWKVAAYKKAKNLQHQQETTSGDNNNNNNQNAINKVEKLTKKKVNEIIDFNDLLDMEEEDALMESHKLTLIQKKKNEDPVLLPQDIQYSSNKLITLFLKNESTIMVYPKVPKSDNYTDEVFFADQYSKEDRMTSFHQAQMDEINNPDDGGEDDVFGGIDFNDALEDQPPGFDDGGNDYQGDSQQNNGLLIGGRKVRPEYVNFSRIAKRVDIKLLKDNLWKGINQITPPASPKSLPNEEESDNNDASQQPKVKKFGEVIGNIGKMYSPDEKKDLSTSFCFICLLHLANEHSLDIQSTELNDDLNITGF